MKTAQELYDFLQSYSLAVISTVNELGLPNGAIVGFGQTEKLELIFGTNNTTRKYKNISTNPHVAFTIGGTTPETIQYEGTARELGAEELEVVREQFWTKNPYAERNAANPAHRYFIVTPTWIRYTDIRAMPWDVTELAF